MTFAENIVTEFDRAAPLTRRHLERIPEDKLAWQPAPQSMSLGQLGLHIAEASGLAMQMATQESLELPDFTFPQPESVARILAAFDHSAGTVRQLAAGMTDSFLEGTVKLTRNGQVVFSTPRNLLLRDIVLNHLYHHRGQMSVYLRLLGVPVPSSFGPTADESDLPAS